MLTGCLYLLHFLPSYHFYFSQKYNNSRAAFLFTIYLLSFINQQFNLLSFVYFIVFFYFWTLLNNSLSGHFSDICLQN